MSELTNNQYKNYLINELVFNSEQTKKILHFFYPINKSAKTLGVDYIDYDSYSARNLAQNMLVDAINKSNNISYIKQRLNDFKGSSSLYDLHELKESSMVAIKEKNILFKNSNINHIKNIKIYPSIKKIVAIESKAKFDLLAQKTSKILMQ